MCDCVRVRAHNILQIINRKTKKRRKNSQIDFLWYLVECKSNESDPFCVKHRKKTDKTGIAYPKSIS